jgi:hypothetical protein
LHSTRLLRRASSCLGLWSCLVAAESKASVPSQDLQPLPAYQESQDQTSWIDAVWELPVFRFLLPLLPTSDVLTAAPALPPCSIAPLQPIEDLDALVFEQSVEAGPRVDLSGLTPATSRALARFQRVVSSAGGDLWLTSAFRPPAYQQHLQSVWDKWVELRDNRQPECQGLKTAVAAEFAGHQLLTTQRPVTFSDHTRGTGFDAAVTLPSHARQRRRRISIDRLARLAGIHRPDIAHDPVHFRLIARSRG